MNTNNMNRISIFMRSTIIDVTNNKNLWQHDVNWSTNGTLHNSWFNRNTKHCHQQSDTIQTHYQRTPMEGVYTMMMDSMWLSSMMIKILMMRDVGDTKKMIRRLMECIENPLWNRSWNYHVIIKIIILNTILSTLMNNIVLFEQTINVTLLMSVYFQLSTMLSWSTISVHLMTS